MFSPTSCICRQGSPLRGLGISQTREPLLPQSPRPPTPGLSSLLTDGKRGRVPSISWSGLSLRLLISDMMLLLCRPPCPEEPSTIPHFCDLVGPVNWACLQLSCCWLGSLLPLVLLPSFSEVCLIPSLPSLFIRNSDASLHLTEVHGGRFKEAAISLPPPAPERTPIALQFSNPPGRQEVPGDHGPHRERQPPPQTGALGAATGPDGGRERVSWVGPLISDSTLFSKSRALDTHWELATARARLAGGTQGEVAASGGRRGGQVDLLLSTPQQVSELERNWPSRNRPSRSWRPRPTSCRPR